MQNKYDRDMQNQKEHLQSQKQFYEVQRHWYDNSLRYPLMPDIPVLPTPQPHNTLDQNTSIMPQLNNTQLELSNSIKQNAILIAQHYLSMAPSYDGKDPKQLNLWFDEVSRLAHHYNMPYSGVASVTSRGSIHRCVKELISQNSTWDEIKVKLCEKFSECTSTATAQNKLSCPKQGDGSIYEYIIKFTDLLEYAYNVKPSDTSNRLLRNQIIEGINDSNKYTKNKPREKVCNCLDYYFKVAVDLQHKQEIRSIDFGQQSSIQTTKC